MPKAFQDSSLLTNARRRTALGLSALMLAVASQLAACGCCRPAAPVETVAPPPPPPPPPTERRGG